MTIELPKMPDGTWSEDVYEGGCEVWIEDEMTSYGLSCYEAGVRAERERAAKLCESMLCSDGDPWDAGYDAALTDCAAAIRKGE